MNWELYSLLPLCFHSLFFSPQGQLPMGASVSADTRSHFHNHALSPHAQTKGVARLTAVTSAPPAENV